MVVDVGSGKVKGEVAQREPNSEHPDCACVFGFRFCSHSTAQEPASHLPFEWAFRLYLTLCPSIFSFISYTSPFPYSSLTSIFFYLAGWISHIGNPRRFHQQPTIRSILCFSNAFCSSDIQKHLLLSPAVLFFFYRPRQLVHFLTSCCSDKVSMNQASS